VAAVHDLEEGNLGVAREVNILGAVGDKLHQTTTSHFSLYLLQRKNFKMSRKCGKRKLLPEA
jgi:hypothetical protein